MSKSNNNLSSQKGIGLLEVIVTITILLLGILSLIKIFPLALKVSKSAEQATIAINLAQAKIEELFYLDYDNINIGTIEAKQRLSEDPENPFYYYQRQTEVEYVDENLNTSVAETGIKKITIIAFWNSPISFIERNTELILLISEK